MKHKALLFTDYITLEEIIHDGIQFSSIEERFAHLLIMERDGLSETDKICRDDLYNTASKVRYRLLDKQAEVILEKIRNRKLQLFTTERKT